MSKKFIAGIYNYCDRWCERCTFTSRCRTFESTSHLTPEQMDMNNKAFWDVLSNNFAQAIELLHKAAAKHGIDLDKVMTREEEEKYEARQAFLDASVNAHLLTKLCRQYQKIVRPFIKESTGFTEKTTELVSELHMGIKSEEDVVHTVAGIGDCLEIIQWYLFFIDAKLQRALHGKLDSEEWEEENGFPKDSDGSAKIALIAIEKSMAAWVKLFELMPATEDVCLQALSLLSQIKQAALTEFPNAMNFKRPGFDDRI